MPVGELNVKDVIPSSGATISSDMKSFLTLSSPVASSGSNLSHSEKQLLCITRAILLRPKDPNPTGSRTSDRQNKCIAK